MKPILSVSELTRIIKNMFDSNEILGQVYVRGEISNFKHHISGHMYFTLKDQSSQLKCVMFKNNNRLLPFTPENGMKVILFGYVSIYIRGGKYQLYVEDIEPDGIGSLHLAFEKLKKDLDKEGLFDDKQKKPIPLIPKKIGIITSLNGAAIKDLLTVIKRRYPNVNILIVPVLVQGKKAANQICTALEILNKLEDIDVIIVSRGGGSLEELWTFNEEKVARAIYDSQIPVISAVGHETDYTIADFVADKRAPTPSAAGELVVPEKELIKEYINQIKIRLVNAAISNINIRRQEIEYIKSSTIFNQTERFLDNHRLNLDRFLKTMEKETYVKFDTSKQYFKNLVDKLEVLNPLKVLKRGYSISTIDDKVIKNSTDVKPKQKIKVLLHNGSLICQVLKRQKEVAKIEPKT